MAKRGNNEGTIYKRSDGRWASALTVTGRKQRSFYGKTRQEVAKKLMEALREREQGLPAMSERQTVGQFLTQWLETAKSTIRNTTFVRYEEYVRLHIAPVIGHIRLARLTPEDVQGLYTRKLAEGLSPTSVRHMPTVLHRVLRQALRWGRVARNVSEAADPPRRSTPEFQPLSPDEVKKFLEAAREDRLEGLYVLAVTTGMRQGEILGLQWRNLDLENGTLQVHATLQQGGTLGEPKTAKARRQIDLPIVAIEPLRRHRIRQMKERIEAGPLWGESDFVFTNAVGRHIDPDNLRHRSFGPLLQRAALPNIRFHDLRHTAATVLMSLGTHPKVVQELLGHSQIAVTMDIYSHVLPTMQRKAMDDLDKLLSA